MFFFVCLFYALFKDGPNEFLKQIIFQKRCACSWDCIMAYVYIACKRNMAPTVFFFPQQMSLVKTFFLSSSLRPILYF